MIAKVKRIGSCLKALDRRHYVCMVITLGFVACGVFIFPNALFRLLEAFRDLGNSLAYYFCGLFFDINPITPTVNDVQSWQITESYFQPLTLLPFTWEEFQVVWGAYWQRFFNLETFQGYFQALGNSLSIISRVLLIVLPLLLLGYTLFNRYLNQHNNNYDAESRALRCFKKVTNYTYRPIRKWIPEFISFLRCYDKWYIAWLVLWAFYFNVLTIAVEFIAFYLYFIVSFDMIGIYRQVYKLLLDLSTVIRFLPLPVWIGIGIAVMEIISRSRAFSELRHREHRNEGLVDERGVMTVVYGPMGAGKTKLITDMALTAEVRLRDMAFEIIVETDFKFPNFHWSTFEQELKKAIGKHKVFSVPSAKKWVYNAYKSWKRKPEAKRIWGYDFERYGLTYNDNLKIIHIWSALEDYASAYLVYTVQSSLLIANYSVRVDNLYQDLGNFPVWNTDFFDRDPRYMESYSRHAHIIDFDMLRMGKRLLEQNPNRHAFGFGVYIISEIDKERKNTLELKEIKANDEKCNQKNDRFTALVKMSRHACVIANRVFLKIFADLQRPDSLGADARELGEVVYIEDPGEMIPVLPFFAPFWFFDVVTTVLFNKFKNMYYKYRHVRSDNTLPMYLLKNLVAGLEHIRTKSTNLFNSATTKLLVESGRMDGEAQKRKHYMQAKKIYGDRYGTDCLSGIFDQYAEKNTIGIDDLPEYQGKIATKEELLLQNSFFQNDVNEVEVA